MPLHTTSLRTISNDVQYRNVVTDDDPESDDARYLVSQVDEEDGEPWNETPVRSFASLAEAIAFAEAY